MTNLVGLAFTSPAIAVMVIDRSRFRVHFYQNKPSELHAFLQEADERLPVVLVDSAQDLMRIKDVDGIHSFLLSDDPRVLAEINGVTLLDAEQDPKYSGFKKVMIRPETLNAALLKTGSFSFTQAALDAMSSLRDDVTLRELVQSVVGDKSPMDEDFLPNICLYAVGALQKRSWISRVQKPALSAGISVERMAELEKFIETAPSAEMLWRAYFDHAEGGVSAKDAATAFEADEKDLEFLISHIGAKKGLKYVRDPREKPLVFKKKRKVRKLQKLPPQGSSMTTSSIAPEVMEKEMAKLDDSGFDLDAVLAKIDKSTGSTDFSRNACAYLCGLIDGKAFGGARRQSVNHGASKKDVVAVSRYIKEDPASQNIWKAFCYYAYYVGVTPADAATKFNASLPQLQTILKYKPMAFVFEFARWPEELE
jgi:hypothetical protein